MYADEILRAFIQPVSRPEQPVSGTIYRQLGVRLWGQGAYERASMDGAATKYRVLSRVEADDLVVNKIWARNGSVAVVPSELSGAMVSAEFPTFTIDRSTAEPDWMRLITRWPEFWARCSAAARGSSGKNRIRPDAFLQIAVPLPPIQEQRRVLAWLRPINAILDELASLTESGANDVARLKPALIGEHLRASEASGQLGEVLAEPPRNGWSPKCDNREGGVPVLSLSAVTGFVYRHDKFKTTSEATDPDANYWLRSGDLLLTRSNTAQLVGHAAIYSGTPAPCIYPDLMMRLRLRPDMADARFVHYWLQSQPIRERISSTARGTSPTMKKINQTDVEGLPFPTGTSVEAQRRLAGELEAALDHADELAAISSELGASMAEARRRVVEEALAGRMQTG